MEEKNKLKKSDKPEKKVRKKEWKGLRQTGAIIFTIGAVVNKKRHYFGQKAVKIIANQ